MTTTDRTALRAVGAVDHVTRTGRTVILRGGPGYRSMFNR